MARLFLVNMNGTLLSLAFGHVHETHMMSEGMHNPALRRCQIRWKNIDVLGLVLLEKNQFRIVLQNFRIVQVNV